MIIPQWQVSSLSAVLVLSGCSNVPQGDEEGGIPVRAALASGLSSAASLQGSGIAAYEREAELSFRVPGVIAYMPVRIGDLVKASQPLARLTATDLAQQTVSRRAESGRAERTMERLATLAQSGAIAGSDALDQRDVVAQARAAMAAAQYDLQSSTLRAPFAGIVTDRNAEVGKTVGSGSIIVRIADQRSPFIVRVGLTSSDAASVRAGDHADVQFHADAPLPAKVLRVQPTTDVRTGTRIVEVQLSRPPSARIGDIASVRIRASYDTKGKLVSVPAEALAMAGDRETGVFTISSDNRARFLRARLVRFDDARAILTGLPVGTRVITSGAGFLRGGEAVVVTQDTGA